MNFVIVVGAFALSTLAASRVTKNRDGKWLGLLVAFGMNTVLLSAAAWLRYVVDEESKIFGIDRTESYLLVLAIPVVTWMNGLALAYTRKRSTNA